MEGKRRGSYIVVWKYSYAIFNGISGTQFIRARNSNIAGFYFSDSAGAPLKPSKYYGRSQYRCVLEAADESDGAYSLPEGIQIVRCSACTCPLLLLDRMTISDLLIAQPPVRQETS